ncbi:GerMN domain-containing protein [Desulfobotulus sp.]|jgi:hypothetical protein|uniref:GerMN domain-containing protein n=1 Tax=Desulfobotulus sp. TaxID=1940337 RepID=UPI002A35C138|nr:GerMN domain-containing protein [Desulfobotulus sp.]MDY0162243.1 GerMN domain-containing protein [Desulfobotulus sp.]
MKLSPLPVLVIGALLLALGFWAGTWMSGSDPEKQPAARRSLPAEDDRERVYLYFIDASDQYLFTETRDMLLRGSPGEKTRSIFEALAAGPVGEGASPLPEDSQLLAVYMDGDMVVLNLHPAIRDNHPGGSHAELYTIYALVNSLVINVPEIRKVKLLIAGQEQDTLAGHIDIRHPLTANMMIVR